MIFFVLKQQTKPVIKSKSPYRSYKNFDHVNFVNDLGAVPKSVCDIFDDPNDSYWFLSNMISSIIDEHVPMKIREKRLNQPPIVDSSLERELGGNHTY